ncbi:hypothetical protein JCM5350_000450 [Sporobolomyces pararoseus]
MSTRSTRKRGRVSYKEDTPDESDAVESAPEEEDDEDEFTLGNKKKKPRNQKKGKGKRGKQESDSDSDSTSDGDEDSNSGSDGEGDDDEDTNEGVDFSQKLPYEIVAEIFSYLTPRELLIFNNSSKSFHSILSGPSSRALWAKSRKRLKIPAVELEGITEQQLATLLFDKECELCGKEVDHPDLSLCKRYCLSCREEYWIKLDDVPKLYPDFHPATTQAVRSTSFSAKARYSRQYRGSNKYSLYSHLLAASEELENLETLDAAGQALTDDEEEAQDEDQTEDQDEENESEDEARDSDEDGAQGAASGSAGSTDQLGRRSARVSRRGGAKINYSGGSLTIEEASKMMKRSRRLKSRWWAGARALGDQLETELEDSFSPRVKRYLSEQKKRFEEWEEIARRLQPCIETIENYFDSQEKASKLTLRKTAQLRRSMIESKLMLFGFKRWSFADRVWTSNKLVDAPEFLTDQEYTKLKKRFKKLAGKSIANQLWHSATKFARQDFVNKKQAQKLRIAEKKVARLEASFAQHEGGQEDTEMEAGEEEAAEEEQQVVDTGEWRVKMLEKPKKIAQKVWKYVLPQLEKFATSDFDLIATQAREVEDPLSILTREEREDKRKFFVRKYQKIVDMQTTEAQQEFLPIFNRFLHLPSVHELYYHNPLYAARSSAKEEKEKADKVWEKKFDEILEECEQYGVDTLAYAVETILSTTTEIDPEELSRLDITHLLTQVELEKPNALIDENFFDRPSSYLICSICQHFCGSLTSVLDHQHDKHNSDYPTLPSTSTSLSPSEFYPFESSTVASSAIDAVFQLAESTPHDSNSLDDLEEVFRGKQLEWENSGHALAAEDWSQLVCLVHRFSSNRTFETPVFILRGRTPREARLEAVKASQKRLKALLLSSWP